MKIEIVKDRLPIITSARLTFRSIELDDISEAYIKWINDPEVTKYLEIRRTTQTEEMTKNFIQSKLDDLESSWHFGIFDEDGKRLIGNITLSHFDWYHKLACLSFVIGHPDAGGKGYSFEASQAIFYYAFKVRGIYRIHAGYYAENKATDYILKKLGMKVEGCLRKKLINADGGRSDHIYSGILADEFEPLEKSLGKLPPEIIDHTKN